MCSINTPVLKNVKSGDLIVITGNPFSIGRGLCSDYVIVSAVISRKHCVLEKKEQGWVLLDCSTNGTFVNNQLFKGVQSNVLNHNDVIMLVQDYEYKFLTNPEEEKEERNKPQNNESETVESHANVKPCSSKTDLNLSGNKFEDDFKDLSDEQLCSAVDDILQKVQANQKQNSENSGSCNNTNVVGVSDTPVTKENLLPSHINHTGPPLSTICSQNKRELLSDVSNILDSQSGQNKISSLHSANNTSSIDKHTGNTNAVKITTPSNVIPGSNIVQSVLTKPVAKSLETVTTNSDINHHLGKASTTSRIVILNQPNLQLQDVQSSSGSNMRAEKSPQNANKKVKIGTENEKETGDIVPSSAVVCTLSSGVNGVSFGNTSITSHSNLLSQMTYSQASPSVIQMPSASSGVTKSYIRVQLTPDQLKKLQSKGKIVTLPSNFAISPNSLTVKDKSAISTSLNAPPTVRVLPHTGNTITLNPSQTTTTSASNVNIYQTENSNILRQATSTTTYGSNTMLLNQTNNTAHPIISTTSQTFTTGYPSSGNTGNAVLWGTLMPTVTVISSAAVPTLSTANTNSCGSRNASSVDNKVGTRMVIDANTGTVVSLGVAREVTIPYDGVIGTTVESTRVVSTESTPGKDQKKGSAKRKSSTPKSKTKLHTSQEASCSKAKSDLKCGNKLSYEVNPNEDMENELQCSICSELFVKAVTLTCSHSFCKFCIETWKKNKSECPICRKVITAITRTLVLDNIIEKVIETSSEEVKQQRKTMLEDREKLENPPPPPPRQTARRGRRNRNGRNNQNNGGNGNSNRGNNANRETTSAPQAVEVVTISSESSTESDTSEAGNDEEFDNYEEADFEDWATEYADDDWYGYDYPLFSLDMLHSNYNGRRGAYYGGYGSCYRCGDPGHWANGCPNR